MALAAASGCAMPLAPESSRTDASAGLARNADEGSSSHSLVVQLKLVGTIVTLDPDFQPRVDPHATFYVTSPAPGATGVDTVPSYSVLEKIQWRPVAGARASESDDPGLSAIVNAHPAPPSPAPHESDRVFAPGMHELVLQAPDRAGGGEVTVRFWVNFAPDTWWAGPEPALWPPSSDGDGRAVDVADWSQFSTVPAWPPDGRRYFGPDSFRFVPAARRPPGDDFERRTFYEIYGDRIYARSEGDAVHLDSWIVLVNGGYDKDSKYVPRVDPADPALPPDFAGNPGLYPLLEAQGHIGSPIGFRSRLSLKLPDGSRVDFAQSGLYPIFDPASVFRLPQVAGYWRASFAGKFYAVARAQDSDGLLDPLLGSAIEIADRVDAGGGTPEERLYRRKILTFHVRPAARPQL